MHPGYPPPNDASAIANTGIIVSTMANDRKTESNFRFIITSLNIIYREAPVARYNL